VTTLTDKEYDSMLAEIESWKGAHSVAAADRDILKALCARAADALERVNKVLYSQPASFDYPGPPLTDTTVPLIAELRKAAQ